MPTTPAKKAAPRKRAPAKKLAPKPKPISVIETKTVPLSQLKMHHENPRTGDVDLIAESLAISGQFKAICVNRGTYTGYKNEILAGNHTYLAMKKNGEKEMLVSFVDVDENQAKVILLADNQTASKGSMDDEKVAELLASLPTVEGTGFSEAEMNALLADAEETARTTLVGLEEEEAAEREEVEAGSFEGTGLGDEDDDDFDDTPVADDNRVEKQPDELPGLSDLKDEIPDTDKWRVGPWGIPALRTDMLMTLDDIPDNLIAWAGSATKNWEDDEQWWLYNWGIDSTSGMKDTTKVIVSFYCWDKYFDNWFWNPRKYVTKLLNSKINRMLTPNFSQWGEQSMTLNLLALYQARYVGRYAQEAGIKVMPDINWTPTNMPFLKDVVLKTLPKKVPVIALQLQTLEKDQAGTKLEAQFVAELQCIVDTIDPEGVLLYANPAGFRFFEENVDYDGTLIKIESRMVKLGEQASKREKKKGI